MDLRGSGYGIKDLIHDFWLRIYDVPVNLLAGLRWKEQKHEFRFLTLASNLTKQRHAGHLLNKCVLIGVQSNIGDFRPKGFAVKLLKITVKN